MSLVFILVSALVAISTLFSETSSFTTLPHSRLRLSSFTRAGLMMNSAAGDFSVLEPSKFLTTAVAKQLRDKYDTPLYVYDKSTLESQAEKALRFPNKYGLTVRFAMKACPNAAILQLFASKGIRFDASSGFEVRRAVAAGIPASHISLSSQELPKDFKEIIEMGAEFNACSLHQLETFGKLFPGRSCGIRFNPGKGSGGTGKTNVGGPTASFGVWHELIPQVQQLVADYQLIVTRIHTHIGSGSDPDVWLSVSERSLNLVRQFPDVTTLNLGGGYKVGRMSVEKSTDLQLVGAPVAEQFAAFAAETGREIQLEIEPGTFLVANAGALLSTVQDIVSTGAEGHTFLKLDSGMTDVLRPSLYGAQHPIILHPVVSGSSDDVANYVVVGHCCESGDLFTCAPGEPEVLKERTLLRAAIGDIVSIEGSGAYCSSMSTKNYNSFPEAPEVLLDGTGEMHLIRRRQPLEEIFSNEVPYSL